ncbi:hypothetical protein F441_07721 [Phytophthora nicotianae CJ01A1]|uniref:Uncharacterized protein n=2 Tax=Phytophthora nicotianae TaxID=4792 RepID=V9FCQ7_PHYNI|nr:hypothetical protein F443_07734 [Phytophthora nicotianae P1569]ETP17937.1 hypothetical protein F441_07721 [Phytophthora nicotianae CJ01A1]
MTDEDLHPYRYGYFVVGAPAQILDNGAGNLAWGVANGTLCYMHSLGWDTIDQASAAHNAIQDALVHHRTLVDLPNPPEFINVTLVQPNGAETSGEKWPSEANLEHEFEVNSRGIRHKRRVIIPIGLLPAKVDTCYVKFSHLNAKIEKQYQYIMHAVDLAFVQTVWKAQGATLKRVALLLEDSQPKPVWAFEHLYVGTTRVQTADGLRCLPLTSSYNRNKLLSLRPNIYTVKWLMSIDETVSGKQENNGIHYRT